MFASIQVYTLYIPVPRKFKIHEIIKSYIVLWRRDPCALDSKKREGLKSEMVRSLKHSSHNTVMVNKRMTGLSYITQQKPDKYVVGKPRGKKQLFDPQENVW
jgi:hypothetical protein